MKIKELIFDLKEPDVFCESFVYEPSNIEEEKFGYLFMIGRIRNVPESSFYLLNLLASRIKREYYKSVSLTPSQAFEKALNEANRVLRENEERINWLGNLDFFVASLTKRKVYFSLLGKMKAFIFREREIVDLVSDIIKEKNFLFPFSTILQTTIRKNDILIFSTSDIFTKDKLLQFGDKIFPIREKRLQKLFSPKESGVALVVTLGEIPKTFKVEKEKKEKEIPPKKIISLTPSQRAKEVIFEIKSQLFEKIKSLADYFSFFLRKKKEEKISPFSLKRAIKKEILAKKIWIFASLFVLFGLLIFSFFLLSPKKSVQENWQKISTEIKKEIQMAESMLIIGEKKKALKILNESLEKINSTSPPPKENERREYFTLKEKIEKRLAELCNREIIKKPLLLFEIKNENWQAKKIIWHKNSLYLLGKNSGLIFKFNLKNEKGEFVLLSEENIKDGVSMKEGVLFLSEKGKVYLPEKEKTFEIKFPYKELSLKEMASYENNFYLFDEKKPQVIKYRVKREAISSPIFWLKDKEKVKGAVSFAIDGYIYFLKGEKVLMFKRGKFVKEIQLSSTYPPLKSLTKIFTSSSNNYFYLLEKEKGRIIKAAKNGKIKKEYQSEVFIGAEDMIVDPKDKILYILKDNKIYQVKM